MGVQKVKFTTIGGKKTSGLPQMISWMSLQTNKVAYESGVVEFMPYLSDEVQPPQRFLELHKPRSGPKDLVHMVRGYDCMYMRVGSGGESFVVAFN